MNNHLGDLCGTAFANQLNPSSNPSPLNAQHPYKCMGILQSPRSNFYYISVKVILAQSCLLARTKITES
jgi:hypothetical protein